MTDEEILAFAHAMEKSWLPRTQQVAKLLVGAMHEITRLRAQTLFLQLTIEKRDQVISKQADVIGKMNV